MTKHEILYNQPDIDNQFDYYEPSVLQAMDEYSKQEMIAFTDWHTSIDKPCTWVLEMRAKYNKDIFTTEEIVNEYLQSKQQ